MGEGRNPDAPGYRPNFTLEMIARHSLDFWLTSEDLPDPDNRVTIDRSGKIMLTYTPNNLEAHKSEAEYPGWLEKLLTNPVKGLENFEDLFRQLTGDRSAIKMYCEVANAVEHKETELEVVSAL